VKLTDVVVTTVLAGSPEEHIRHCLQNSLAVDDVHAMALGVNGRGHHVWLAPTAEFIEH
jgi:hypothetical protein